MIDQLTQLATANAIAAGATEASIAVVDVEEVNIPYMASETTRIRVRVVGDLTWGQRSV